MGSDEDLFLRLIQELDNGGVLQQIVLIGSWALPIYRKYFDDDPEIPLCSLNEGQNRYMRR